MRRVMVLLGMVLAVVAVSGAQEDGRDTAEYVDRYEDPIIEEMEEANTALREAAEKKTEEILAARKELQEARDDERKRLRFDMTGIERPAGPDAFSTRVWHFPPTPQYLTGTCWSFATTSLLESEIKRTSGAEIKLSEMWSAYWEFVAKAQGYVASRGKTNFYHGSQSAAVMRALEEHGVVPRSAYEGVLDEDGRFNHDLMHEDMMAFLEWCRDTNLWDEEIVVAMVRRMLDERMGRPPVAVLWKGGEVSPQEFLSDVCRLDPDDYVDLMSTMSEPFWQRGEYRVPDNWWYGKGYVNVPLDAWFEVILEAVATGHSVVVGGDVSEPGLNGFEDIAVVPTFDIPGEYIDQSSRELRFYNKSSTDDHLIHIVGHTVLDGHDWFLIKDSNRSSRHGRYEGYYMYRDDYVKLKMLMLMVHKDVVEDILERVDGNEGDR